MASLLATCLGLVVQPIELTLGAGLCLHLFGHAVIIFSSISEERYLHTTAFLERVYMFHYSFTGSIFVYNSYLSRLVWRMYFHHHLLLLYVCLMLIEQRRAQIFPSLFMEFPFSAV
jgi:hypothetical protein